jgi:hypothetical protein
MPPTPPKLRWRQVIAWRLGRHHLGERVPAKAMLDVVAGIAGLHAQVMSSAELTLRGRQADRVHTFTPPPTWVRRAAEAEAERLAAWTGGQLELRWGATP